MRQRVLLARVGMAEHREILADGLETGSDHLVGRAADDDVIAIAGLPVEQAVTHRAADQVAPHRQRSAR